MTEELNNIDDSKYAREFCSSKFIPQCTSAHCKNTTHQAKAPFEEKEMNSGIILGDTEDITKLLDLRKALSHKKEHVSSCGHIHTDPDNVESEDWMIKMGKVGEFVSAVGVGIYTAGPLLSNIVQVINPAIQLKPNAPFLYRGSNQLAFDMIIIASAIWMGYGSADCHAHVEKLSRMEENLIKQIDVAVVSLRYGQENPYPDLLTYDSENIPDLNSGHIFSLVGDVAGHVSEFIGLWLYLFDYLIENNVIRLILSLFVMSFSVIACFPEARTCRNALLEVNALEHKKVTKNVATPLVVTPSEVDVESLFPRKTISNDADYLTNFSAFFKLLPIGLANTLAFQQIFFGHLWATIPVASLITIGTVECQRIINANTQKIGTVDDEKKDEEHKMTKRDNELSLCEYTLVIFRMLGTGSERAEPIVLTLFNVLDLSPVQESVTATAILLATTLSTLSDGRNAIKELKKRVEKQGNYASFFRGNVQEMCSNMCASKVISELRDSLLGRGSAIGSYDM